MARAILFVTMLCSVMGFAPSAQAQATFTLIQIEQYYAPPMALSGDGRVLVGSADGGAIYAFRWTRDEGATTLQGVPAQATGVSYDGSVIVGWTGYTQRACRWGGGGKDFLDIGIPGGAENVSNSCVSADGRTIFGTTDAARLPRAWRWTEADGMVLIGGEPNGAFLGASLDGALAVGRAGPGWFATADASYWTASEGFVHLGVFQDGEAGSGAAATTPAGNWIVGGSSSARAGIGQWEAFRWSEPTGMVPLGEKPGGGYVQSALDVSADGRFIVGGAHLWDADHGLRDLNDLLPRLGADLHGWVITDAIQISDNGRVIAGWATVPGYHTALIWLATLCPADCNEDAAFTVNDFICFQSKWRQKASYADYNGDGIWDINDFVAFQSDWRRAKGGGGCE